MTSVIRGITAGKVPEYIQRFACRHWSCYNETVQTPYTLAKKQELQVKSDWIFHQKQSLLRLNVVHALNVLDLQARKRILESEASSRTITSAAPLPMSSGLTPLPTSSEPKN